MVETDLVLFELAGADEAVCFSPHCWKTRMALAHKRLSAKRVPWRFTEKQVIAFSGQECVPVLVHDGTPVSDSWKIATYLEDHFPQAPSLAGESGNLALCAFFNSWADAVLLPAVARVILPDVYRVLDAKDRQYFRTSREARFGMPLEALTLSRHAYLADLKRTLAPLSATLKRQSFLAGSEPNYADYCVFGMFMWSRCVSDIALVEVCDPIHGWNERMLDLFGGMARAAPIHH